MQINWCILLWVGFCHSHRHPIFPCLLDMLQLVRHWVSLCCLLFGSIMSVACGTPEIHQFPTARLITAVNCLYHRTALYFYYLALGIIISSVFLVCCPYYMLRAGHQLSSLINSACAELVYQTIMWAGAFKSPLSNFTISALSSDHLFFFFCLPVLHFMYLSTIMSSSMWHCTRTFNKIQPVCLYRTFMQLLHLVMMITLLC